MKTMRVYLGLMTLIVAGFNVGGADCVPTPSGLVSWWRADGNGDDVTGANSAVLRNGAGFAEGNSGQGFQLDGVNDDLAVADSPSLDLTNEYTIELWFRKDQAWVPNVQFTLFDKRDGAGHANFGATLSVNYGLILYYQDPQVGGFQILYYDSLPTTNVFHHFAGVYRQTGPGQVELKSYLDGQLVKFGQFPGELARSVTSAPLTIGSAAGQYDFFRGVIDDVSIYGRALSASEIAGIFNAGSAGKCVTPVAPVIVSQPANQTVQAGNTASFNVIASGTAPLAFQWRDEHGDIGGATQSTLTLSNVQMSQAGSYAVVVTNSVGAVTSTVATLTVTAPPSTVRIVSTPALSGGEVIVPVELVAQGTENAAGFSLNFDPTLLTYLDSTLGASLPAGSTLVLNTNLAGAGKLGMAVALPASDTLPAGAGQILLVRFAVVPVSHPASISISFGDQPTTRQISNAQAQGLPSVFVAGNVTITASSIRVVSTTAASGGATTVRVQLVAQGNENALGFSLNFSNQVLSLEDAVPGVDLPGSATFIVNGNNAAAGSVGIALALAAGAQFSSGTQEVAVLRFAVAPVLNPVTVPLTFVDQPTTRQLSDGQARVLPSAFLAGNVAIVDVQFEGDAAPRPGGDRMLTVIDWVQVGRFVAGLDTPGSPEEFQRIDCAPRATKGNGAITVTDYVQVGRYMVGLDPLTPVGGPTSEGGGGGGGGFVPASIRTLWLGSTSVVQGQSTVLPVTLEASGTENAIAFSVKFDPAKLQFVSSTNGAGATTASLTVNANQATSGKLGFVVGLAPGNVLAAGTRELVKLQFAALANAPASIAIDFGDQPVFRETSDVSANALNTDYTPGTLSVVPLPGPPVQFNKQGNTLVFSWPENPAGFELEGTAGPLGTSWSSIPSFPAGDQKIAVVTIGSGQRFFRLKKP